MLDLEIAGEFLVMASTLMYIKSRELLPKAQQAPSPEEEEGEDPRWELIRQLVEYKKFKDAAAQLQAREWEQENSFPRLPVHPEAPAQPAAPRAEASIFDLINSLTEVLKRVGKREDFREIIDDRWTVSDRIEFLLKLTEEKGTLKFLELFAAASSRAEVVCTFLALLELIRLKKLVCTQMADFEEIEIARAPVPEPALEPAAVPGETNLS
jgi:segregation and condensation protein A